MGKPINYEQWCIANNYHHYHCPLQCEHPQPFVIVDSDQQHRLVCGRCWVVDQLVTDMIPCTEDIC